MPTWAIILLVFMGLLSTEAIFKGFYNMKIQKFMMERDVSLKKIEEDSHRQESIHNGLQEADNMFQELKKEKDIHLGDSFVFSLYVTASMSKKKEGIYYDVYIEEKKVSSRLVKPNES